MAILGLLGIVASVVWTGVLYFIETQKTRNTPPQMTQEELEKIIKQNNIKLWTGGIETATWSADIWTGTISTWALQIQTKSETK